MGFIRHRPPAAPSGETRLPATAEHVTPEVMVRNPTAATQGGGGKVSILGTRTTGTPVLEGNEAWTEAYYANTYLYACVRAIAQDLSARPIRVGADPDKPSDFNPKHPLALLLGPPPLGPMPGQSSRRLIAWTVAQYMVQGRFGWEVASPSGRQPVALPFELWPLATSALKPVESEGGAAWFSGFCYETKGANGQPVKKDLTPRQVMYCWRPGADNWRTPESAIRAAGLDISVAVMQDRYDYAFLKNDARPAIVIVHEAFDSIDERDAWRRSFLGEHRGPDNAGKTRFVETTEDGAAPKDALLIQAVGLSQKDAEFIARYEAKIRSICVALGVPLSRLGDSSKRTFSNADRETLNYWRNTVQPHGVDIIEGIAADLMPRVGDLTNTMWFDWSGVPDLEPPKKFAVGDIPPLLNSGVITTEEARVHGLGLPPMTDEQKAEVEAAKPEPPPPPQIIQAPAPAALPPAPEKPAEAAPAADATPADRSARGPLSDLVTAVQAKERRSRLWHQTDKTVRNIETVWTKRFDRLFARQKESVLSRLNGKRGRQFLARAADAGDVFDADYWAEQTDEMVDDLYRTVYGMSATALSAEFGITADLDNPAARDFIAARANKLSGQITDTTFKAIQDALLEGVKAGEGTDDLARRIDHLFDVTWKGRSEMVARTEVISGYNGATADIAKNDATGEVGGMEWIATSDDRTRDDHDAADGMIVKLGDPFNVGGEDLEYPGDPGGSPDNVINCRCTVAPVLGSDMGDRAARRDARDGDQPRTDKGKWAAKPKDDSVKVLLVHEGQVTDLAHRIAADAVVDSLIAVSRGVPPGEAMTTWTRTARRHLNRKVNA